MPISTRTTLQRQLDDLYHDRFSAYTGGKHLSYPLLPVVTERYLANRIVVLGQETNGYYNQHEGSQSGEDLPDYLKGTHEVEVDGRYATRYAHFIRALRTAGHGGHFWRFARLLYRPGSPLAGQEMIDEQDELGHMWLNLFAVEAVVHAGAALGRPTSNSELRQEVSQLQGDLLRETFELLRPRLVLACTGPRLDEALAMSLGLDSLTFETIDNAASPRWRADPSHTLSTWQLGKTRFSLADGTTVPLIRTYHPTYFMGRINQRDARYVKPPGRGSLKEACTASVLLDASAILANSTSAT